MKTFQIFEDGQKFATIKASTGAAALRRAAREYPRNACDYNCEPGEKFSITWRACEPGQDWAASAEVNVPGRGDRSVKVFA